MEQYVTRDELVAVLEQLDRVEKKLEQLDRVEKKLERLDRVEKKLEQLDRMEKNQQTMIGTLNELLDAYREQQSQLTDHEARIDKLERGN